jgi:hypothetical protein
LKAATQQEKLDVTLEHVCKIFTYFQVMPSYIDFISVFTVRPDDEDEVSDLRFSGFRERVRLSTDPNMRGLKVDALALSGRAYQLSYNLKCIANKTKEAGKLDVVAQEKWQWSPRQAAIHHQFDVEKGTTLWIVTAARTELQMRIQDLTDQAGTGAAVPGPAGSAAAQTTAANGRAEDRTFTTAEDSFIASLSVHLLLAQWASEDWRSHLRWLEQVLEKKVCCFCGISLVRMRIAHQGSPD